MSKPKAIYIEVEDEFHDRLKARATHEGRKLTVMCREVLAEYLDGGESLVTVSRPRPAPAPEFDFQQWQEQMATTASGKRARQARTAEDLLELLTPLEQVAAATLELRATQAGFTRDEYRGLVPELIDREDLYPQKVKGAGAGRPGTFYSRTPWPDAPAVENSQAPESENVKKELLNRVPVDAPTGKRELVELAHSETGISRARLSDGLAALLEADEPQVFEWREKRSDTKPRSVIARFSQPAMASSAEARHTHAVLAKLPSAPVRDLTKPQTKGAKK